VVTVPGAVEVGLADVVLMGVAPFTVLDART